MTNLGKYVVLSEQYLPEKGGHVVLLHELGRRLGQVHVLTARFDGAPDREDIESVKVHRVGLNRRWWLRPESLPIYAGLYRHGSRLIRQERPAAVIAARALPEGCVANLLSRRFGLPSIVFAHGEEISPHLPTAPRPQRRKLTVALKRRSLWRTYHRADLIIANSRFTRDLLLQGGVAAAKVAIVHPGTDPARYRPLPRDEGLAQRLGLAGRRVLLTVGRLTWRKGQEAVLQALPAIRQAVPDAIYAITSDGPRGPYIKDLARTLGLEDAVRFLGEVPFDMLPALYNLADVFVMPSRVSPQTQDLEGFGIVFLEAGACGLPVVGGRSGGIPDAVAEGETGLLVDGTQPDEVAAACVRLLKDRSLARLLGTKSRERVLREFTWDHAAARVGALIDAVVRQDTVALERTSAECL
jgi:phosphatidyl-myo-inositol dimannoside synthase